ncbi:CRISPR-associated protein Cas4 [Methanothermobacter thermautotrophicus]|uniref:CRISPR-associated exonuclease Cas4 n=1 Tax=Methanothermobacter thermautotrophicus TaxID=145262 RepID=A0A842YLQ9_METTF|nr:CRISPR-associated protein Cas4 [Methanothermobacter thermautotrophicus]MBE2900306.1 CRISPR-associated protein Cas4 [Methanothermobacter thermautotrophicus]
MKVTGVMVQYYVACKRELWFFANQINMNYDNEDIQMGRLLHEKSFSREKKSINFGDISIDFMNKKNLTIFEIKKSSRLEEPVRYQLYYYLWYIRKFTGKNVKGVLVYPTEKKREEINLTPEVESEIEKIVKGIKNVVKMKSPPEPVFKRYCRRCSYYEFCMI